MLRSTCYIIKKMGKGKKRKARVPRFTLHQLRPYAGRIGLYLLCAMLSVLFTIATAMSVADFLKLLFDQPPETSSPAGGGNAIAQMLEQFYLWLISFGREKALVYFSFSLLLVYGMKNLFGYLAAVMAGMVRSYVVRDVRNRMHAKMLNLPVSFFSSHRRGEVLSRFSSDVSEYEQNILVSLQQMVTALAGIALYLAMLFYLDWRLTLFTLFAFPVVALVISRISHALKHKSSALQEKSSYLMSLIEETMTGLKIVKSYTALEFSQQRFREANRDYTKLRTRIYRRIYSASPVSDFMSNAIVLVILLVGSRFVFDGTGLPAELFISYIMLFVLIVAPLKEFSTAQSQLKKGEACADRIDAFLHLPAADHADKTALPYEGLQHGIELSHVWFAYEEELNADDSAQRAEAERHTPRDIGADAIAQTAVRREAAPSWVVRDLSLPIPKGTMIAFTGSSGSGKSTVIDLLLRFYDCCRGSISVDGHDLRSIAVADWRRHIGVVAQDTDLFNDTVRNNIAFGYPNATRQEIEAAARLANAHDFIMQLPAGYDTNIGNGGSLLSGGQRQRLSIARAVLREPDILILDEATSALDTESERQVQVALEQAMKGRTVIVVAHRLSTIVRADEIVVLEQGTIVEQGSHPVLLERGGRYKQLWDASRHLATASGEAVVAAASAEGKALRTDSKKGGVG